MQPRNFIKTIEIKKVLIIKGPGVGDSITTIPLARNFKEKMGCEVHVLEEYPPEKQGKTILSKCPYIDRVVGIDYHIQYLNPKWGKFTKEILTLKFIPDLFKFLRDIRRLRKEKYDMVFDGFPGTRNTYLITKIISSRYRICCGSQSSKEKYDMALDIKGKNIVQIENSFFEMIGIEIGKNDLRLEMFNSREAEMKADEILQNLGIKKNDVLIGINTGQTYKKWQNEKWAELMGRMKGAKIVMLGNSDQVKDAQEIQNISRIGFIDLVDKLNLEEAIAVMRRMNLFLCTNGGLMWVAVSLGLPTVAVSGPTPYWWDSHAKNCLVLRKASGEFYEQKEYSVRQPARTQDLEVDDAIKAIRKLDQIVKSKSDENVKN